MPDASYICKDARPLNPRNVESPQVHNLPNWF